MNNYLNNAHHKEILSCGIRHMAAVDINCVGECMGYNSGLVHLFNGTKIISVISKFVESKKTWINRSNTYKIGKLKFCLSKQKDGELNLKIKDKNCIFGYQSDVFNDCRFIYWFTYHYDFSGLGELEDEIYKLAREFYVRLIDICVKQFHTYCNPNVDRKRYNPEVCARNISFTFWACQTMINAIDMKSFDDLSWGAYRSSAYCVNKFEDIVNKINKTDFKHSRLYYNEETDKREQKANADIVRAAFGLR